ncbi:cpc1/kpl2 [Trypanosoma theileri]|uniref:Cpc1/kpl2 n=1 Tax=Trypanosoma theileri TaxID=67003 RepID=A0A1X0NLJ2_9TRYP|nr:cpc1/kpl2 [Trypanosoma theileri]ORC85527.1 cpc1/kpl2 [Trypanosoma theileri]
MDAAEEFVVSLLAEREEEERRREARRRRRVDFITAGNEERARRSKEELGQVLKRSAGMMSCVEREFRDSLGEMCNWWDLISEHILEERRECKKAVELQKRLNSMYLSTTLRREFTEQSSVVENDERRFLELVEFCEQEENRTKEEVIEEVINSILISMDNSIDFMEEHALVEYGRNNILADLALNSFIRKHNHPSLTENDIANIGFLYIFGCHPFHITGDAFLFLIHTMYDKMNPEPSEITRYDVCRQPVFLIDGPKLSGKTVVSREVSTKLSLLHLTDRDLVKHAIEAYRNERDGLPTLRTVEDSEALPVLTAYEERNEADEEVAYHSDAHVVQVVESFVRLSPWAEAGAAIEAALLRGEAVDPAVVVRLARLQMSTPPAVGGGLLFDGVVAGLAGLQALERVIPPRVHPHEGALKSWPPAPPSSGDSHNGPAGPLLVRRLEPRAERPPTRSDGKVRPPKKGVDLSALPPPVLPEVERPELTVEETQALVRWEQHLRTHTHSLFSAIVYIHCGVREIFGRFAGLRIDKETLEQYHMVFNPPPPDRVPYVVNLDRTRTSTAQLHRVVLSQQKTWEQIQRWLLRENGENENVHEVNGEQQLENIVVDVKQILENAQKEFVLGLQLHDAALAAKERQQYIERTITEQEENRENERKRLIALYNECGAPIPPELEARPPLSPYYSIPNDLPGAFINGLLTFTTNYEKEYAWFGTELESLVSVLLEHRILAMNVFYRFWNQPDEKQLKLDSFTSNYNQLPVALLGQVPCKEELHLLVDHLKDELFRIVECTRNEANAKIENITKRESFLGPWSMSVCNIGVATAQLEVERFLTTLNLTAMYFGGVVSEPCIFEDLESELIIMRSTPENVQEQTKGKEKKTQGTKKGPKVEEVLEKTIEDMFVESITKLVTTVTNYVEKILGVTTAATKIRENGKASITFTDDGKPTLILSKCLPFAETELEKVQERISIIQQFFIRLLREGEVYCARMKDDMLSHTREKQMNQASAVNTAIYVIRNAIEEERSIPDIHLGRDTFYIDPVVTGRAPTHPELVTEDLQTLVPSAEPKIHPTLTVARLIDMIHAFQSVAPDYALSHTEYLQIVRPTDYSGAATKNERLKTQEEVFASFDPLNSGVIDWREFVIHLLLWCAPVPEVTSTAKKETTTTVAKKKEEEEEQEKEEEEEEDTRKVENYYIPECSVTHLLETRADLGLEAITRDVFFDIPFFFDKYLSDERLESYVRLLWMTFAGDKEFLDPMPLLAMLCIDRQPIRGAQKAFYVLSTAQSGTLTIEDIDRAFHVQVNNARNMCLPDVFSKENIATLYDGAPSLSFQSVCERAMGRNMLNSTEAFRRKSFTTDAPHVE